MKAKFPAKTHKFHAWGGAVALVVSLSLCGTAKPESPTTLTPDSLLTAYLAEALQNHPDLESMRAMIEAQEALLPMSGSWMNPNLMLGIMSLPTSFVFHEEAMTSKEIGVMFRVPFPGKLRASRTGQQAAIEAAKANYEQSLLDMTGMVKMAYYDLAGNLAVHEALLDGQRLAAEMVAAANLMTSSGMGSQADVLQAQLQSNQWQQRLIDNEELLARSRYRLAAALGRFSAENLTDPNPLPPPGNLTPLSVILNASLDRIPIRQAQNYQVERARAEWKRAQLSYYPDVDITFKYGFRDYLNVGAGDMGSAAETTPLDDMLSLELSLPLPLFYRGNQRALVQENEAMLRQTQADYRTGNVELRERIQQGYARWEKAQKTYRLITDQLHPSAELVFKARLSEYQRGALPLMSLTEALMQLVMQKMDQVMAWADFYMAKSDLERLLGRRFE